MTIKLGINIIPMMPVTEIIEMAHAAEDLGFEYLIVSDEGLMQDVYVVLGVLARETQKIKIGPCTNGYTRHPAVTAAAMASLNEISNGRAFITLIAGGSLVLGPMNIPRQSPLGVARDTIEIMRRLWKGDSVTWQGERFALTKAQLAMGRTDNMPIWFAPRGDKMCELTGEMADCALMMVKADLPTGFSLVDRGSEKTGNRPLRAFIDNIAYTPEMIARTTAFFPHVVVDTPARQLSGFLSEAQIAEIQEAVKTGGAEAAKSLVTTQMIKGYKIAGTPEESSRALRQIVDEVHLDIFVLNIVRGGLQDNLKIIKDVHEIVRQADALAGL
jgi:5,10-methylenetetrahydromethanopterin reductase